MTSSPARPDLGAFDESLRLPADELVSRLSDALGAKLVAYTASLKETRTVAEWASGDSKPSLETEARLRIAYRVVTLLQETNSITVVQQWLQGRNELLGGRAPVRLLRDSNLEEFESAVVAAVRAFAA